MPLRMIDWRCRGACRRRWEELTSVTSTGEALAPRCCGAHAERLIGAPAIRTNDNFPRDMRLTTTAGHLKEGVNVSRDGEIINSQLGRSFSSRDEHDAYLRDLNAQGYGIEIVSESEENQRDLGSKEPPPLKLEDHPQLLREQQEFAADMWDRAEADALPLIETPMLDEDVEGRRMIEQMTSGAEAEQLIATATADEEGA